MACANRVHAFGYGQPQSAALSHMNVEWIGRILFDNLVYLDEHGNATLRLAKSWTISPDGRTYTFS